MTDVAEAIVNGEGESSSTGDQSTDIKDGRGGGTEDEASLVGSVNENNDTDNNLNDNLTAEPDDFQAMETSDSASNQVPDGLEQQDPMDEEDKDDDSNSKLEIHDNNTTTDGETVTEDDTIPGRESPVIKIEMNNSNDFIIDETRMEEEDEQNSNSAEDSEPVLLNCNNNIDSTAGADATDIEQRPSSSSSPSVRNGRATMNDNDSSDKPLLTGLLKKKDSSLAQKSATSQGHSFSLNDGNAIAKGLEDHVDKLDHLLALKEKEWSGILRLKKHLEYALDQVKCTQRMGKVDEGMNGPMSATDVKACLNLIVGHKDLIDSTERGIEESIEHTEEESEYLQTVFPCKSEGQGKEEVGTVSTGDNLAATAALQQLCERKRKGYALEEILPAKGSKLRIIDVRPQMQQPSRVIGNGRKGAIVDVQSIIESHRHNSTPTFQLQRRSKKPSYSDLINLGPERQYVRTIEDLATLMEIPLRPMTLKEPTVIPVPTTTVSQISKPAILRSKNGRPTRPGGNSLLANPAPSSSGTLAKMLSPSTHSSIGSNRGSNDSSTTSQKFVNKHSNADGNLSLANLLATSKVETKLNISKIKKERIVRDEEPSHVPSQQEAVPICQGCNLSRAQFVCAGCANQWYCSRECQVAAWDEHSEICSG